MRCLNTCSGPRTRHYTSLLSDKALFGARVGLYGPGFRNDMPLSEETRVLYEKAIAELKAEGAIVIEDPFAGSGFNEIPLTNLGDSFAYDFNAYLARMGPDVPAHNLEELREVLPPEAFASGWGARLAAPGAGSVPDLSGFVEARTALLKTFMEVFEAHDLDVLVFPHDASGIPMREGGSHQVIATPVINVAGLPGVVVPAGVYSNGMPFSLIFIGPQWSEAQLLAYAYDYEQATRHRIVPELVVVER